MPSTNRRLYQLYVRIYSNISPEKIFLQYRNVYRFLLVAPPSGHIMLQPAIEVLDIGGKSFGIFVMAKLLKHIGLGPKKVHVVGGEQGQEASNSDKRDNVRNFGQKMRNKDKSVARETFVAYCPSEQDFGPKNDSILLRLQGINNICEKVCQLGEENGQSWAGGQINDGVLILPDYSDPLDFRPPVTQCPPQGQHEPQEADDDYADPCPFEQQSHDEAGSTSTELSKEGEKEEEEEEEVEEQEEREEEPGVVNVALCQEPPADCQGEDDDEELPDYDHVSHQEEEEEEDIRPSEDYDQPWEWRRRLNTHPEDPSRTQVAMMAWHRPFYETAFDSAVQRDSDVDELDRLVSHVACRTSPPTTARTFISREAPTKERRKVTLVRERDRSLDSHTPSAANRVHVVRAMVHEAPRSANSTPVLAHRAVSKLATSSPGAASSTRSTPTRATTAKVHVPVRQFSDLALGSSARGTGSPKPMRMAPLPPCAPNLQMQMLPATSTTVVSSLDSLTSTLSSASSGSGIHTDGSMGAMDEDLRPTEDYDKPWDRAGALSFQSTSFLSSKSSFTNCETVQIRTGPVPGEPLELKRPLSEGSPSTRPNLKMAFGPTASTPASDLNQPPSRSKLTLNFDSQSPKRPRQQLQLNFGCAALSAVGEKIDQTVPLQRQGWYHGSISRVDAENLLRVLKEGSYLVRNSESSKTDYSLSLKSARGFMHMRIVDADGKYVLGQFSKPFSSIPEMIHHYSINKLPIKGAEHMSLLHPVIDQLL